jgi:hypothetical protein
MGKCACARTFGTLPLAEYIKADEDVAGAGEVVDKAVASAVADELAADCSTFSCGHAMDLC